MNTFIEKDIRGWFAFNGFDRAETVFDQALLHAQNDIQNQEANHWLIQAKQPQEYIGYSFAAICLNQCVWFGNPLWGSTEYEQLAQIVKADIICDDSGIQQCQITDKGLVIPSSILIATGGTSGKLKFARHRTESFRAAAEGLGQYLYNRALHEGDFPFCCDLPLYHVSGWIQVYRAFLTQSIFRLASESNDMADCWVSLVPTQLRRYLQNSEKREMLKQSRGIFVGGASCPPDLAASASSQGLSLWLTYGMTETAGMIAATRANKSSDDPIAYDPLPHVSLTTGNDSRLIIDSPALFSGYNLDTNQETEWISGDMAIIAQNKLQILGRDDRLIITGGEKVIPGEVESAIIKYTALSNVYVTAIPDDDWGQKVVVLYESPKRIDPEGARALLNDVLASYKIPKIWIHCPQLPFDEKGKINSHTIHDLLNNSIVK